MLQRHMVMHDISDEEMIYRRVLRWHYRVIYTIKEDELLVLVVEIDSYKQDPQKLQEKFGE